MDKNTKDNKTIISVGATSRIAIEMQRIWARSGYNFILYSRSKNDLKPIAQDLVTRGASNVSVHSLKEPPPQTMDILLISIGSLSVQDEWNESKDYRHSEWVTNTSLVMDWIEWGAKQIEESKKGKICVITSVAADRAKKSNYGYGAAKAALDFYLQGVAHRLNHINQPITILKPGPTRSPMTNSLSGKTLADPKEVANDFCKDIERGKFISYSPKIWRYIMLIIKCIPRPIWHKTNF